MGTDHTVAFAELLKRHRTRVRLSQEELAEHAGVSARSISDLERGLGRSPRAATIRLLAEALVLSEQERTIFEALARGEPVPGDDAQARRLPGTVQLTPFIGREREVTFLRQTLLRPDVRLVTLTGPGGTGKTRLALEVAEQLHDAFEHGVRHIALAAVDEAEGVLQELAHALEIVETASGALLDTLEDHLRDRQRLLVLDNFEQVVLAAPLIAHLLAACPQIKVLVTSRVLLRVTGEHDYPVPPLSLPPSVVTDVDQLTTSAGLASGAPSPSMFLAYEAVQLFVARAQARKPQFALTTENGAAVVEICRRLDGLPLPIELAAARVRLLSPQALLPRLANRLGLLVGGAQDLPERQRTLRATLDWSYDLLADATQRLLRRLAVFPAGCTLESGEAVCASEGEPDVLEDIITLIDSSLLIQEELPGGEVRIRMLETIREYALARLAESGEAQAVQQRHAAHYLQLAEAAEPELVGQRQGAWLMRLETEHDNLRAAIEWSLARGDLDLVLRLGAALWRFWFIRGYFAEWERWLAAVRARLPEDEQGGAAAPWPAHSAVLLPDREPPSLQRLLAKVLFGRAVLLLREEHFDQAVSFAAQSLRLYRGAGDRWGIAATLVIIGKVAALRGEEHWQTGRLVEGVALARAVGEPWLLGWSLFNLGEAAWHVSEYGSATAAFEESLSVFRGAGDQQGTAWALTLLGWLAARYNRDFRQATMLLEAADAIFRAMEDKLGVANALLGRGMVALAQDNHVLARALNEERQTIEQELGNKHGVGHAHVWLGLIAAAEGDDARAQAHWEESLAIYRELDNHQNMAWVHNHLGWMAVERDRAEQAYRHFKQSLALSREAQDHQAVAHVLGGLGEAAFAAGDYAQAAAYWHESLACWRKLRDPRGTAAALAELAKLARAEGSPAVAQRLEAERLALRRGREAVPDPPAWQSPWRDWRR